MAKIKIRSNPYEKKIEYFVFKELPREWEEISMSNPNSRLREDESEKSFLPFKIKEIIDIIVDEYYVGTNAVEVIFEGTLEEYEEVIKVCQKEENAEKIKLTRTSNILENARFILKDTKDIFKTVQPVIEKIVRDDEQVTRNLNKVADALDDIIPICVFGNYSAGKSTFINALIGSEILPSGGDPVTAKIYRIAREEQTDIVRIRFAFRGEPVEICFEGNVYRVLKGSLDNEILMEIKEMIDTNEKAVTTVLVNKALEIINGFEKKDKEVIEISDVIELDIPFSKNGILGQSHNNFVIFDTPGSNSNSNLEHSKVLGEALQGFSNGIPVWISQYESIDSNDNAKLCEDVLNIQALDKRFTMIVLNKADSSDLPEDGFTSNQVKDILEYNSVEKMYAGGIYFVSSIMGLGAKNNGELIDKHYRKIYRSQLDMFSDPEDMDYATLYQYNIMPEQIKNEVMEYSAAYPNLVYANSGLYCVENEMEEFASKYSAYNKCQMVYKFLNEVIDETNKRITTRTETIKRSREKRKNELEEAKQQLIDTLEDTSFAMEQEFDKASRVYVRSYVSSNLEYHYAVEALDKLVNEISSQNSKENNLSAQEKQYERAKDSMWNNLKSNGQNLFKGNIVESIKSMKDDLVRDYREVQEKVEARDASKRKIDEATSDTILNIVTEQYKINLIDAKDKLSMISKKHWHDNAQLLRSRLIEIITGSDALSSKQREELSGIIINYQALEFNDDADNIFIKSKFLRGNLLGIQFSDTEQLNIKRLASIYNDKINKNISEMATVMNESCYKSFKTWKTNLDSIIEQNITEYNPQLRDMAEMIREETEKINELEDNQKTISSSLEAIRELMSWKELA